MNIEKLIVEGRQIIACDVFPKTYEGYRDWCQNVSDTLEQMGVSQSQISQIKVTMHYVESPFSSEENLQKLKIVINDTINCLRNITKKDATTLSDKSAMFVVKKILENFYLHIKAMYQEKPHGNGEIKQEDLSKIVIGNEYDVQRILYSLLRPIFPEARTEVNADSGYSGFRYDICIKEYNLVIEVKCSRPNMTEKSLTEELGADAFHYKAETLFMFIYDKENIIKNVEAFKAAHYRTKESFEKDIEVFIVQPVRL